MVSIDNNHFVVGAAAVNLGQTNVTMNPTRIVVHYTAGSTLSSAVSTLQAKGFSYNILIDTNGSFHQARGFNRPTSHAGRSNWKAASGLTNSASLNQSSIGISIVNLGQFGYLSQGKWWWGGPGSPPSISDQQANKHSSIYRPNRPTHWTPYLPIQISQCHDLIAALVARYPSIVEIVGHDDIAIGAKSDPGPLCPVAQWRNEFNKQGGLGLQSVVKSPDGELNLRDLPGTSGVVLKKLHNGDVVHIRSVTYSSPAGGLIHGGTQRALTGWASVDVNQGNAHSGFVYMGNLTVTPLAPAYAAQL